METRYFLDLFHWPRFPKLPKKVVKSEEHKSQAVSESRFMFDGVRKSLASLIIGSERTQKAYSTFEEFISPKLQNEIVEEFHKHYYGSSSEAATIAIGQTIPTIECSNSQLHSARERARQKQLGRQAFR